MGATELKTEQQTTFDAKPKSPVKRLNVPSEESLKVSASEAGSPFILTKSLEHMSGRGGGHASARMTGESAENANKDILELINKYDRKKSSKRPNKHQHEQSFGAASAEPGTAALRKSSVHTQLDEF